MNGEEYYKETLTAFVDVSSWALKVKTVFYYSC
jgi:hypothetical protein